MLEALSTIGSQRYGASNVLTGNNLYNEIENIQQLLKLSIANMTDEYTNSLTFVKLLNDGLFKAPMNKFADQLIETVTTGQG